MSILTLESHCKSAEQLNHFLGTYYGYAGSPLATLCKFFFVVNFYGDMPVVCIDMGACNFSNLPLINITEIMSISLVTVES